jgi:hypothetical protein
MDTLFVTKWQKKAEIRLEKKGHAVRKTCKPHRKMRFLRCVPFLMPPGSLPLYRLETFASFLPPIFI